MRPRLIAAENLIDVHVSPHALPASMRPRLIAAENAQAAREAVAADAASMRPRLIAAENNLMMASSEEIKKGFNEAAADCRGKPPPWRASRSTRSSFNEAAADCRGKQQLPTIYISTEYVASMRPRLIAAENMVPEMVTGWIVLMLQ